MSATTSSTTPFFSFGPDDSFISKNFEGLRYRHLPASLKDLILNNSVLDVHWASLGPIPESWIFSFKDASGKTNLSWGPSIPSRLQAHLSKLTPSPHLRTFLGPQSSYICWDPSSIRWSGLPASLEDSLQAWLTPSGWKAGPPRLVTWGGGEGGNEAFFAMSEYGDVAYRSGGDEWPTWKETVEEWKAERAFVWSEVAYVSIDSSGGVFDQFVAIRNDGTWAGAIDDSNEQALEAFAVNFFRLVNPKRARAQTNGYANGSGDGQQQRQRQRTNEGHSRQQSQSNGVPRSADATPDPATQAQYESWATSTASLFASALAANTASPARKAPKKLQIRSPSTNSASPTSIPTSASSVGQGKLLSSFPYFPATVLICRLPTCATQKSDSAGLRACKHDVERLLRASGLYSYEWLRQERIRWHPDRFGRLCEESWRENGKRLAEEMFKVVDVLIGEAEKGR